MSEALIIKACGNTDSEIETLVHFCKKLAEYDGYTGRTNKETLSRTLQRANTHIFPFIAYLGEEPIGFIIAYEEFLAYSGDLGLYIAGAYIDEPHRGRGFGKRLFQHVAQLAKEKDYPHVSWLVSANNEAANHFYDSLDTSIYKGWNYVRLKDKELRPLE